MYETIVLCSSGGSRILLIGGGGGRGTLDFQVEVLHYFQWLYTVICFRMVEGHALRFLRLQIVHSTAYFAPNIFKMFSRDRTGEVSRRPPPLDPPLELFCHATKNGIWTRYNNDRKNVMKMCHVLSDDCTSRFE